MKFYLIVNPIAGQHRGERVAQQFLKYFKQHQISATIFYTHQAASFKQLLTHILKQIQQDNVIQYRCIVIGGDGTLNEILNTLILLNQTIPIAYFPAGTGNDFNRQIQQTTHIKQWLQHQMTLTQSTPLEYLWIEDKRSHFQQIALNSLGIGLDAQVCHLAQTSKFKRLLGKFSYPALLLKTLPHRQTFNAQLMINQQSYQLTQLLLLTIANHCYYGGGIAIAPNAQQNDHHIHIIALKNDNIKKLVTFAQQLFNKHIDHYQHQLCHYFKTDHLSLTIPAPSVHLQIDGESILLNYPQLDISLQHYPIWL